MIVSGLNHVAHMCDGDPIKPKKSTWKKLSDKWDEIIRINKKVSGFGNDFYGAKIKLTSYNGGNNWTAFGTIHTSKMILYNYMITGLNSKNGMILMHEYGHYLQSQLDPIGFYTGVVPSSMVTANYSWSEKNWTEIQANTMAYYYFHYPSNWNFPNYPIDHNYLSDSQKSSLYYH